MSRPVAAPKKRAKPAGRRAGNVRSAANGSGSRQRPRQRGGSGTRGDPLPTLILDALEQTQAVIGTVDGRIVHWSRGAERLYGWTADEAIGCRACDLLKQKNADDADVKAGAAEPWRGGIAEAAISRAHKDGRELAIAARCLSRCDLDGQAAVIELDDLVAPTEPARDAKTTGSRQTEAAADPIGRIIHEFNNLLGIITLNLELARERAAVGGDLHGMIEEALDAAWQGSELTGRLAAARRRPLPAEPTGNR
jgi:PAS domain S-box-containing protein